MRRQRERKWVTLFAISCCLICLLLPESAAATTSSNRRTTAGEFPAIDQLSPHQLHLFNFLSGGLSEVVWKNVTAGIPVEQLTAECRQSLLRIQTQIDTGSEWAFQFPDAGSKSPSGLLDGTLTSFGDYDQCLAIQGNGIIGKYCGMHLRYTSAGTGSFEIDDHLSRWAPVSSSGLLSMAICVPNECTSYDVKSLAGSKLSNLPFTVVGEVTCDTAETVSWMAKVTGMSAAQITAAVLLMAVTSATLLGTLIHALDVMAREWTDRPVRDRVPVPLVVDVMMHFSLVNNVLSLVRVRKEERFVTFPEIVTVVIVFGTLYAQSAFLVESVPLGLNVIYRNRDLHRLVTMTVMQPFFSDGFYGMFPFIAGFVTLQTCQKAQSFNILLALLRKYVKTASAIGFVLLMEFIWPILSQGPLYSRASAEILDKCEQTWWRHLLMIANFHPIDQMCSPHLTVLSIHMQMFPIGLILSFLIIRIPRTGIKVTLTAAVIAVLNLYSSTSSLHSPALFDKELNFSWTKEFLSSVLISFPSQLVNYLFGLVTAYALSRSETQSSRAEVGIGFLAMGFALYATALHNSFDLIPQEYTPFFVIAIKISCCTGCGLMAKAWQSSINSAHSAVASDEAASDRDADSSRDSADEKDLNTDRTVVSFRKAHVRLMFTTFLVSYFLIRLDHFSSRMLFTLSVYDTIKRYLYLSFWSFLIGMYVYMCVVAPLKSLRDALFGPVSRHQYYKEKQR